jgi:nephrocystin-4
MEFYRKQSKTEQIRNKLQDFITTECRLYPSFGSVEFFEYVITNPFSEPQTISVLSTDPELQVVTDEREWRNLKILNQMYSETEDGMFNRKGETIANLQHPHIFLRPKETVHIPFKFQTFSVDSLTDESSRLNVTEKFNQPIDMLSNKPTNYSKVCHVTFQSQNGNPVAVLKVYVEQQSHIINQTFRFNVAEQAFLKKTIRLPSSTNLQSALALTLISRGPTKLDNTTTHKDTSTVYVRCSDKNVICESKPVPSNEPRDVFVKVRFSSKWLY